jgi:hypothetical protein
MITLMNLIPVAEFGAIDPNKSYFVYDKQDGFAVARGWTFHGKVDWEVAINAEDAPSLLNVTHVAELPPNPLA